MPTAWDARKLPIFTLGLLLLMISINMLQNTQANSDKCRALNSLHKSLLVSLMFYEVFRTIKISWYTS